jgi:hypothetical protein
VKRLRDIYEWTPLGMKGPKRHGAGSPPKSSGYHDPSYKPDTYRSEDVAKHLDRLKLALSGATNPHEKARLQQQIQDLEGALHNSKRARETMPDKSLAVQVLSAARDIKNPQVRDQFETAVGQLKSASATHDQWARLLRLAQSEVGR